MDPESSQMVRELSEEERPMVPAMGDWTVVWNEWLWKYYAVLWPTAIIFMPAALGRMAAVVPWLRSIQGAGGNRGYMPQPMGVTLP